MNIIDKQYIHFSKLVLEALGSLGSYWFNEFIGEHFGCNIHHFQFRGIVDDDSFIQAQNTLKEEKKDLQRKLGELDYVDPKKLDRIYKAFDLSQGIDNIIRKGTVEEKKTVLMEIGSNLTLKDKIISVSNNELYSTIINGLHLAKQENPWFEPEKYQVPKEQNTSFEVLHSTLLRG